MVLTLFDLDHTLLPLDTNQAWLGFLCDEGLVDARIYRHQAAAMKARYLAGGDDPDIPFCEFFIGTLTLFARPRLDQLRSRFIDTVVTKALTAAARRLVEQHRQAGDALAIITATNRYLTEPVAALFGIEALIATECACRDGVFTGGVAGLPSMRSGKVTRLLSWLAAGRLPGIAERAQLDRLRFYSDSINDRALLEYADEAIAVDPDAGLCALAKARQWPIISLREANAARPD